MAPCAEAERPKTFCTTKDEPEIQGELEEHFPQEALLLLEKAKQGENFA